MGNISRSPTSRARRIAALYDDDGSRFVTDSGRHILDECIGQRASIRRVSGDDAVRYTFADNSAIVVVGDVWDLALDDGDIDCACMDGSGYHADDCAYVRPNIDHGHDYTNGYGPACF